MDRKTKVELTNMCILYDDDGNVLVEDKITKNGHGLIFPGGHIECNESAVDSMIREFKEETGLTISNLEFCGIKDWIEFDGSRYMVFLYKTNKFSGYITSSDEGKVFWMPLAELKKANNTLWHMDQMLEIFCGSEYSELYFNRNEISKLPTLK